MANLVSWEPFREMISLREAMDSLFENALIEPRRPGQSGDWGIPLDVTENEDSFVVKASIPGANPEDLEVTVIGDVLSVKGEIKSEAEKENERYHVRERRYGSFSRSVTLPAPVEADQVQADYQNGILTLTLPKTEEVKPKRIAVKSVQSQSTRVLEGQAKQR
jgi:HSP20 family protein